MSFFQKIEYETSTFTINFFEEDFKQIAHAHRKVIQNQCSKIYENFITLDQKSRSLFIKRLQESNDIENICNGNITPLKDSEIPSNIKKDVIDLFKKLYSNILLKEDSNFSKKYGSMKNHFKNFRANNKNLTLCPMCDLNTLKTEYDIIRDPYDHYLAKSIYPFSTINFNNLIPICNDCNSTGIKGNFDILSINGKAFYPFDEKHQGITCGVSIEKKGESLEDIDWSFKFSNPEGKNEEINTWKTTFQIENRYIGHIKGHISNWLKRNLRYKDKLSLGEYLIVETDSYLMKPVLDLLMNEDELLSSIEEMKKYTN
ncbi:MAG: hypothetical protein ABUK01_18520 [Leptospirales bacterium]